MSAAIGQRALVTGGAGMVGTSLCARLLDQGVEVLCVDDLSLGTERHVAIHQGRKGFQFQRGDVSQEGWHRTPWAIQAIGGRSFDLVVHLAANSDISLGRESPEMDARKTFSTTLATLLAVRELKIPRVVFSSSSAVYGAEPRYPTPESSPELHPVSIYGAGKLASEVFLSAFVENYGISAWVYRFGNVVGGRLTHGVIYDFLKRLKQDPSRLQVLGNGLQNKTYIDVEDCVDGMLWGLEKSPAGKTHRERFQVFNLSTEGATSVREIAEECVRIAGSAQTQIAYGDSSVGWVGDVAKTSLAMERMSALGWRPRHGSTEAVKKAIQDHFAWNRSAPT